MWSTTTSEEARAFLQKRLVMLTRFVTVLFGGLYIVINVGLVATSTRGPYDSINLLWGGILLVAAAGWRLCAGVPRSRVLLRAIDALLSLGVPTAIAPMALEIDPSVPGLAPEVSNILFATMIFLLLRTAFVPSSAQRTATLHTVAMIPAATVVHVVFTRHPEIAAYNPPKHTLLFWLAVFVVCTSVISHVIYGLQ